MREFFESIILKSLEWTSQIAIAMIIIDLHHRLALILTNLHCRTNPRIIRRRLTNRRDLTVDEKKRRRSKFSQPDADREIAGVTDRDDLHRELRRHTKENLTEKFATLTVDTSGSTVTKVEVPLIDLLHVRMIETAMIDRRELTKVHQLENRLDLAPALDLADLAAEVDHAVRDQNLRKIRIITENRRVRARVRRPTNLR